MKIRKSTEADLARMMEIYAYAREFMAKPGIGSYCLSWALTESGHLKVDTHSDNKVLQHLMDKLGFEKRGIIHVVEDNYPRFAYEKKEANI